MEHTKGPWKIEKRDGHSIYGVRPVIVPEDGSIDRIAVVSYRGGATYPSGCDANATLIAAAPDLLLSLKDTVNLCRQIMSILVANGSSTEVMAQIDGHRGDKHGDQSTLSKADAAIRNAGATNPTT